MSERAIIMLFYSDYSISCKLLRKEISQNPVAVQGLEKVRMVNIDNPKTRLLISRGKEFSVKVVPTLIIDKGDVSEVFQGKDKIYQQIILLGNQQPPPEEDEVDFDEIPPLIADNENKEVGDEVFDTDGEFASNIDGVKFSQNSHVISQGVSEAKNKTMSIMDIAKQMESSRKEIFPGAENMPFNRR